MAKHTRVVLVTNIPVHAYIEAWVAIPTETPPDKLDEALTAAVLAGEYSPTENLIDTPTHDDLDKTSIASGWEFSTPLEP